MMRWRLRASVRALSRLLQTGWTSLTGVASIHLSGGAIVYDKYWMDEDPYFSSLVEDIQSRSAVAYICHSYFLVSHMHVAAVQESSCMHAAFFSLCAHTHN